MDLKQLRTFRAVAELGSLSKAADRLRAAQPALSRHIKLLEHELRVELFVRNGRGMLLTSAGRMLLDRTTGLIRQIEQVQRGSPIRQRQPLGARHPRPGADGERGSLGTICPPRP